MLYKPYYIYRKQFFEQSLSGEKSQKVPEENISDEHANSVGKGPNISPAPSADPEKICSDMQKEPVSPEPVSSEKIFAPPGFKQIAPGFFQFTHPSSSSTTDQNPQEKVLPTQGVKDLQGPRGVFPEELRFLRVDGIPGPFQNYRTPIYQFT